MSAERKKVIKKHHLRLCDGIPLKTALGLLQSALRDERPGKWEGLKLVVYETSKAKYLALEGQRLETDDEYSWRLQNEKHCKAMREQWKRLNRE